VLALGRDLGLVTVAEGVESREGWDLLTALGCDLAQGFVVCPPLTSSQFDDWLDRRQPEEFAYLRQPPDELISITDEDIEAFESEASAEVEVDADSGPDPDDG
jgi:hypothetical protein